MKPKWRLHAPLLGERAVGASIGTIAFSVVFIGLDQLAYHEHAWTQAIRAVVSLGLAALVGGAIAAVTLASQQFELLLSAGRPRYQRWRKRVLGRSRSRFPRVDSFGDLGHPERFLIALGGAPDGHWAPL